MWPELCYQANDTQYISKGCALYASAHLKRPMTSLHAETGLTLPFAHKPLHPKKETKPEQKNARKGKKQSDTIWRQGPSFYATAEETENNRCAECPGNGEMKAHARHNGAITQRQRGGNSGNKESQLEPL